MNTGHQDYSFDLGTHQPAFLETNEVAGLWFARGLAWLYGFNHEEAVHCFRAAAQADDGLALAWWGIAISSGPFMNLPWSWLNATEKADMLAACLVAVREAEKRAAAAPPEAQALIAALAVRYPQTTVPDDELMAAWERDYADAMADVYEEFGEDPDIAAFYIDAQIMLTPWQIYDVDARAPNPDARAAEIHAALDRGLAGAGADHIGLLHYDIHVNEMSPTPEAALVSARRLEELAPADAGHLQHMPSHIYMLTGDLSSALHGSHVAIATDRRFMANLHRTPFYRTLVCHDAHMLMFAGMQTAHYADASEAGLMLTEVLAEMLNGTPGRTPETHMEMTLEGYLASVAHIDVRFGRWQQIVDRAFIGDPACLPVSWAMYCQARAVALAALGRHAEATDAVASFDAARRAVPEGYAYFNNKADDVLAVGNAMMRGEVAYHAGQIEEGLGLLRDAVEAEDRLVYTEPRAWMHPPRHALGALLMEQGRIADAAVIYESDLGHTDELPISRQNRGNIWSLSGLAEAYRRLDDPRLGAAEAALALALPLADQPVTSSCFCRGLAAGA